MSSYQESVDKAYSKIHEKTDETNLEQKDNSMFGQEVLEELGIIRHEREENELSM